MNLAPIILFTYKRLDTLQSCVVSLQKCPESAQSDLIIVSDYAATGIDIEKVQAVRQFLPSITGFKTIEIIERTQNLGVDYNIIAGIQLMAARFPQFIVVEDDLVVQDGFLHFMNTTLDFYANNPDVLSITAFSFVEKIATTYPYSGYFAKRTCPWGWGTWSHKIKDVDWEIEDRDLFLSSRKIQRDFDEWGSDRSRMLNNTLKGLVRAWDIRLDYYQFKEGFCTLYPCVSYVDNIGFNNDDASNTFGYNRFKTKLKAGQADHYKLPITIFYDKAITKKFIWKNSLEQRIFTRIMKLLHYKN